MRTGVPASRDSGRARNGAIARMSTAPASVSGRSSKNGGRDIGPVGKADGDRRRKAIGSRAPRRRNRPARSPADARRPRRTRLRAAGERSAACRSRAPCRAAREAPRRAPSARPSGRRSLLVAAGAVQKQDRRPCRIGAGSKCGRRPGCPSSEAPHVGEASVELRQAASISSRRALEKRRQLERMSQALSAGSSTAKPGGSVAISNRTRPARGNRPSESNCGPSARSCACRGSRPSLRTIAACAASSAARKAM